MVGGVLRGEGGESVGGFAVYIVIVFGFFLDTGDTL